MWKNNCEKRAREQRKKEKKRIKKENEGKGKNKESQKERSKEVRNARVSNYKGTYTLKNNLNLKEKS